MNSNINKKLEDALKKVDPKELKRLAASKSVQNIIKNLSNSDRQKLIAEFSSLDSSEIQRKLSSANLNNFSGMSADEIIRHLKSL